MTLRVCIAGITGWTGTAIAPAVETADDLELVGGVSRSDPAHHVDRRRGARADARRRPRRLHARVGRQGQRPRGARARGERRDRLGGLSAADFDEIDARARDASLGVVSAGNFSLSAALLLRSAVEAARHLDTWEIIDYASAKKTDAPSGTARELAERLAEVREPAIGVPVGEVVGPDGATGCDRGRHGPVHSLHLPSFVVSTEVVFAASGERLSDPARRR